MSEMNKTKERAIPSSKANTVAYGKSASRITKKNEELKQLFQNSKLQIDPNKKLGEGGGGIVYDVQDPVLGRSIALKSLKMNATFDDDAITRFLREGKLTSLIEHPNVIPVYSMGVDDTHGIFYTMKKVNGDDLQRIIYELKCGNTEYRKKYTLEKLLEIFISACQGIAFAHSKGLIHRDIKPENIFIGEYGEVLVSDWGLIKKVEIDSSDEMTFPSLDQQLPSITVDGELTGTPLFIAPEQIVNKACYSSDQYSLGATLYHILTFGYAVDEDHELNSMLKEIYNGRLFPLSKHKSYFTYSKELEAICMKAMARDISDRYQSVNELIEDLNNYRYNKNVNAYPASLYLKTKKWAKRNPVFFGSTIAALTASIIIAVSFTTILLSRYENALSIATDNYELGTKYYDNCLRAIEQQKDDDLTSTTTEIKRLYKLADMYYSIAFAEYQKVGPNYKANTIKRNLRILFENKINLALTLDMKEDFIQVGEFIRIWSENYKGEFTQEEKERLHELKVRVSKYCE